MKNYISTIAVLALFQTALMAGKFEDTIEKTLQDKAQTKVKVISANELKNTSGLKLVIIELEDKKRFPLFANSDASVILGMSTLAIFDKTNEAIVEKSLKELETYNVGLEKVGLDKIFKSLKEENIITLTSTVKENEKKMIYIVTDPECPYCREELRVLDAKLKLSSIKIVLAPVHKETASQKSQIALDVSRKAKTNKEKIDILNAVYAENYVIKNAPKDVSAIEENKKIIFSSKQITGVPFIYEVK